MNFFDIYDKNGSTKLIKDREKFYSIKEIMDCVKPVLHKLKNNPNKNAVIISENNFDFIINFLASVFAKKEIFLMSDRKKLFLLDFEYILLSDSSSLKEGNTKTGIEPETPDFNNTFINLFTSGSSGKPKHIRKTLKNLFSEAEDIYEEFNKYLQPQTEIITSTSPRHMFALANYVMLPLLYCDRFVINTDEVIYPDSTDLGRKLFISTPSFLEQFKKHGVKLGKKPCLIFTAGDKLKKEIYEYFSNTPVCEIYGSTETGTIAYKFSYDSPYRCMKGAEVSTDDASQIVIKSPYFMEKQITLCDIIENHGEKFYLKKRSDRIIKIQEKRINAMEIEEYINKSEYVDSCYCVKSGDKLGCAAVLSEKGKLFYLEKTGGRTKLIKHLKSLVKDKSEIIPQKWKFLPEIPKNKTGKVDKEKIESLFAKNLSFPLILDVKQEDEKCTIKMVFSNTCNFFCGHFDEFPVLPGVVQLYFAHLFAEEIFKTEISKDTVKKVKFSHIIKPDEELELVLEKSGKNIGYTYRTKETVCSSGTFNIQE